MSVADKAHPGDFASVDCGIIAFMSMTATQSRLLRIAPEMPAANLREAIEYYVENLGFELASAMPDGEYAIVERDGVAIHLFRDSSPDGARHPGVAAHVFVDGMEGLYAELAARGAEIAQAVERKPWGNRDFRVRDPFGNELKFTEAV
jgi:uncharacterized glyoxalase superfamily protein PhnB